jgi:ketosteroid isomerase-like protein
MSQENVKVVRALFEAWNARDMDATRGLYHPDVLVRPPENWPEPGPWLGRDAVIRQWQQMRDTWEADDLKMLSYSHDVGDRVATRLIWHGAGQGPQADLEMTGVHSVRDGRLLMQEFFWDHAEALAVIGLTDEAIGEVDLGAPAGLEIVRQGFDRWRNKDLPGSLELFDEDCEIRPLLGQVEGAVYRGHEGVRRWFDDVYSHWTEFRPELHAFAEAEASLLIAGRVHARGRHSGVELDTTMWWTFTFRGGRVWRLRASQEPTDAHRAAGLVGG